MSLSLLFPKRLNFSDGWRRRKVRNVLLVFQARIRLLRRSALYYGTILECRPARVPGLWVVTVDSHRLTTVEELDQSSNMVGNRDGPWGHLTILGIEIAASPEESPPPFSPDGLPADHWDALVYSYACDILATAVNSTTAEQ